MNSSYDAVIRESSQRQRISIFNFAKTYPAFIALIIGVILSGFVWNMVDDKVQTDRAAEFDKAVSSVSGRLEAGFEQNVQVLASIDGLYRNSVQVVRDMFELYGSIPTRTNASIQSIYYIPYIPDSNKAQFIYYAQSERHYDYSIKPTGIRPYYLPVEYVVPLAQIGNRSGFDIAVVPEAEAAIKRAREANGKVVASPFYNVRPDTLGFIMAFKVENKPVESSILGISSGSREGYVVLETDAAKFFERALGTSAASDTSIIFEISDSGTEKSIYVSKNHDLLASGFTPLLSEYRSIPMADRSVRVRFTTVPDFGGKFQALLPLLSLIAALTLSFAAFGFTLSIATSRARALDLADRLTQSQRRIIEASKDIIAVLDLAGNYKTLSPAAEQILGYSAVELFGKNIAERFVQAKDRVTFKSRIEDAQDETGVSFDVQMSTNDGKMRWLSWSFVVSRTDGNIYATGRDVTLQKQAEEQIRLKNRQVQLAEQQALQASESKSRFMRDLSHKLRNNLTGTLGFLQLLSGKFYQNEEEEQYYIEQAESSSDQLFSVVTDIIDVADESETKTLARIDTTSIDDAVKDIQKSFGKGDKNRTITITPKLELPDIYVVGEPTLVAGCFAEICAALAPSDGKSDIEINARVNSFEKVAEIEILAPYDETVAQLIAIYKQHGSNLVDALIYDNNDALFNIGLAISSVRRLNGTIMIDSLGEGTENVCLLTLPLARSAKAAMP